MLERRTGPCPLCGDLRPKPDIRRLPRCAHKVTFRSTIERKPLSVGPSSAMSLIACEQVGSGAPDTCTPAPTRCDRGQRSTPRNLRAPMAVGSGVSSSKTRVRLTERRHNSHRFFLSGLLEGGRLFHAHAIKHARENRNVGLVLDQRTEMIGVK